MPELPEVETIVRDLARTVAGRRVEAVEVLRADLVDGADFAGALRGVTLHSVERRAKNIVFGLGGGARLLVNLGMTGRLIAARPGEAPLTHLGVRFRLDGGGELRYHDARRFGRLWRLNEAGWRAFDGRLGVEPLDEAFTPALLLDLAGRSRVAVKTWLMDQARVVGVGNIYASEALHRAGIDPRRPARTLTPGEAARLAAAVRGVLREAIDFRGTTLLDYRDASGNRGGFAARLRVYDRAGDACAACREPVQRMVQGGRSTFFCPGCQR